MRSGSQVSVAETEDGLVLLDEQAGIFYHLNPAGALVYRALKSGDAEAAISALVSKFRIDEPTARHDVGVLSAQLIDRGLLRS